MNSLREAGIPHYNEFQLYGADNMKAREHVEWVLLRCREETCLMILLLSYGEL